MYLRNQRMMYNLAKLNHQPKILKPLMESNIPTKERPMNKKEKQ